MAKCDYCGTGILFGGTRQGQLRFCSARCQQMGFVSNVAVQLPQDIVDRELRELHQGNCPVCSGRGPVDVHTSHQVWSALVLTRWVSKPKLCCRSCGRKSQLGNMAFSLVCGWWGFPWGLILTPVQITRNVIGMFGGPNPSRPSPMLI